MIHSVVGAPRQYVTTCSLPWLHSMALLPPNLGCGWLVSFKMNIQNRCISKEEVVGGGGGAECQGKS